MNKYSIEFDDKGNASVNAIVEDDKIGQAIELVVSDALKAIPLHRARAGLICDKCGEKFLVAFDSSNIDIAGLKEKLRRFLKTIGWISTDGGMDYCPVCAKERGEVLA